MLHAICHGAMASGPRRSPRPTCQCSWAHATVLHVVPCMSHRDVARHVLCFVARFASHCHLPRRMVARHARHAARCAAPCRFRCMRPKTTTQTRPSGAMRASALNVALYTALAAALTLGPPLLHPAGAAVRRAYKADGGALQAPHRQRRPRARPPAPNKRTTQCCPHATRPRR